MKEVRNNILFFFAIVLVIVSLVLPMVVLTKYHYAPAVGKVSVGTINLTVLPTCGDGECEGSESCLSCENDCGVCVDVTPPSTGSGGGGGGGRSSVLHMIDFNIKDEYIFYAYKGDRAQVVMPGDAIYKFKIGEINTGEGFFVLTYTDIDMDFTVYVDEITYFDMDANDKDDFSVYYGKDNKLIWSLIAEDIVEPGIIIPKVHKEKISDDEGFKLPKIVYPSTIIGLILVIFIIVLLIFLLQHLRISGVEKKQKGKLERLHKKYMKIKKRKGAREAYKEKLRRQKDVLKKAYVGGHVRKSTYKSSLNRINRYLGKTG